MTLKDTVLYISLLVFLLASCKVERPGDVLSDAKMEEVLHDYYIARAMGDELPHSEHAKKALYIESVFKKHDITEAVFDTSMVWFARNPDVLAKVYEQVNKRLKQERDDVKGLIALRDNKPKESQPGDSIDVWAWQRLYRLSGLPMDNKLTFVLPSDLNFEDRDTLRWNVSLHFLKEIPDSAAAPIMALQMEYSTDSIIATRQLIRNTGIHTLTLAADTLGSIKEIRGFIYYPRQKSVTDALLIDSISLMRYHATDSLAATPKKKSLKKEEELRPQAVQKLAVPQKKAR